MSSVYMRPQCLKELRVDPTRHGSQLSDKKINHLFVASKVIIATKTITKKNVLFTAAVLE